MIFGIFTDKAIGILLLGLMGLQGMFMMLSPGSVRIQKPEGGMTAWIYNIFNLFFLLVLPPLVACGLIGLPDVFRWTHWSLPRETEFFISRIIGVPVYILGCILIYWSRVVLGKSFRLGAVRPGREDRLVISGPFQYVRHPMYTAVILMAIGLSFIGNSWFILALALTFIVFIVRVIPIEEAQLEAAYKDEYQDLRSITWRLLPWIY
jgi:protein-S-isoprenylcysteine O-methyltransferase Ste14